MITKRLFGLLIMALPLLLSAQNMKEIWLSMPESMMMFLKSEQKAELISLYEEGSSAAITNLLGGESKINTIGQDFLDVSITEKSTLQIKRLFNSEADSLLCVVKTFQLSKPVSSVEIYTTKWQFVKQLEWESKDFMNIPDTISAEKFADISASLDLFFVQATLNSQNNDLLLNISLPMSSNEDNIRQYLIERKINL